MSNVNEWRLYCTTEAAYVTWLLEEGVAAPTTCPNNTGHTIGGSAVISRVHYEETAHDSEGAVASRLKKASWGKNYYLRPLVFTTSKIGSLVDRTWNGGAEGGVSLKFYKDVSGNMVEITGLDLNQAYLDTNCVQTRVEVRYDNDIIEVDAATIFVPNTLAGSNDDAWSYAMIMAPTTIYAIGLTNLIPLKFHKAGSIGQYNRLSIGQSVEVMKIEPDTLGGLPLIDGHIMHFLFNHPAGAQTEFMIEGICYK